MMKRIDGNNGFNPSSWAARIGLLVVGILSGGVAARTAVPVAAGAICSAVPRLWAAAQSWLAPPYLFFAVHVIILVIWKLSENKQSHLGAAAAEKIPQAAGEAKAKAVGSHLAEPLVRNPSPEFWQGIQHTPEPAAYPLAAVPYESPPSDASCITANSEETSPSPPSSVFEVEKESAPGATITAEAPAPVEAEGEEGEENASMEATWEAIMEKSSRRVAAPPSATNGQSPMPPPPTIHDEMNKKFEEFIKKHHSQMRLQRHESHHRRTAEMGNRSRISN